MSDEMNDAPPADTGASLATGIIVITTVVLAIAVFAIWKLNAMQYGEGPLA